MKIGFIGLGLMGSAMCPHLIDQSGCEVQVFDVQTEAVQQMTRRGAIAAQNSRQIGECCDVIFTMVPKTVHVQAVYAELLPSARKGQIFADMSTIDPTTSRELAAAAAAAGARFLDAPVVKSRPAALAGQLGIYVGGDRGAFEQVLPLLRLMGKSVLYLGENGSGLVMKLCHNALVAQIQNGVNETMALAACAAGIDTLTFAQAIACGGGQNFYLDSKKEAIAAGDFTPAFSVGNMDKDIHLAQRLARVSGLDAPGIDTAAARYEAAMARGLEHSDFCATWLLMQKEETGR